MSYQSLETGELKLASTVISMHDEKLG